MSKNLICCSKKKMRKDEEGSVVILVAVLMVVFLGMAALVVDLGADYVYKAKMHGILLLTGLVPALHPSS